MRLLLLAALAAWPAPAQYTLYTCASMNREYVVGSKTQPSGIFRLAPTGWQHAGFNHPFAFGLDYDPRDPSTLYIASGNGLIRASDHGENWKILTGSDVTELRDVAVDRNAPGTIYFAHCAGIRVTHDSGVTWRELTGSMRRHYTEAIRVDRRRAGVLIAGTEQGLFRSEDGGETWKLAGASGFSIMRIEQSPHDPCHWLAVTQMGGAFASHDCGVSFENQGRIGVGRNLYDIAFDPTTPGRIAIAGWGPGVAVSADDGKSWTLRNAGLPRPDVWSIVFDPAHAGRLYASVQEEALYVSDDAGSHWRKTDLDAVGIPRMRFIPDSKNEVSK